MGATTLVIYGLVLLVLSIRYARATRGHSVGLFLALGMRAISEVPLLLFGYFPELFAQLSTALEAHDPRGAQRAAHAMKGVISVFHAPAAYAAAKQLEESARAGQVGGLETLAAELRQTVSELLISLERFVAASPLLSRAA